MNREPPEASEYLRAPAAAAFLQAKYHVGAVHTLGKWRWQGVGPRFHKFRRVVLYSPVDLIAWAEAEIGPAQKITSKAPPQRAIADAVERHSSAPGKRCVAAKKANEEVVAVPEVVAVE